MSEDERQEMLRTVAEAHSGLREVAFKLGREMKLKAPVLKEAIRAEGVVFRLMRKLQQLDLENPELIPPARPVARGAPGRQGRRCRAPAAQEGSRRRALKRPSVPLPRLKWGGSQGPPRSR